MMKIPFEEGGGHATSPARSSQRRRSVHAGPDPRLPLSGGSRAARSLDASRVTLISLANTKVPITSVLERMGVDVPGDRLKFDCPFGWLYHIDGGDQASFRVYEDETDNSAYCVDYETQILSTRGWLSGDDVSPEDTVLTYRDGVTRWEPVEAVIKLPEGVDREILEMDYKTHSSRTTGDHRWLVDRLRGWGTAEHPRYREEVFTTSKQGFGWSDRIPYGGPCVTLPELAKWSDAFVELVAWFFTEGSIKPSGGQPGFITISQSHRVNAAYCARISAALESLLGPARSSLRTRDAAWRSDQRPNGQTVFVLSVAASQQFLQVAPDKVVIPEFIASLTRAQLNLFLETALDADGTRAGDWKQLCQKHPERLDAVQMAGSLLGHPVNIWKRKPFTTSYGTSDDYAAQFLRSQGTLPAKREHKWVVSDEPMWCVQTPSSTWIARRRGTVYVTGNCFAGCGYFTPVRLWAMNTHETYIEAARALCQLYGIAYTQTWDQAVSERPKALDTAAMAEAFKLWCRRSIPDFDDRQFDPDVSARLNHALTCLDQIQSRPDLAPIWMESSKKLMKELL